MKEEQKHNPHNTSRMTLETLAHQGKTHIHSSLASVGTQKLQKLRNEHIRLCFAQLNDQRYRMEYVARIRGMEFYNDAASRTVNATWYALQSTEGRMIWIANGDDPKADYAKIVPVLKGKVTMLICVGADTSRLHKTFDGVIAEVVDASNIQDAVQKAYYSRQENVKVIYSPAGENGISYEAEGYLFTAEVNEL